MKGKLKTDSNRWYEYTVTIPSGVNASDINFVFNDGNGNQTADTQRGSDGWYNNGTWTNNCPTGCNGVPQGRTSSDRVVLAETSVDFSVYPIPATDQLKVDLSLNSKSDVSINVVALDGKVVYTKNLSGQASLSAFICFRARLTICTPQRCH